ncbi:MAG: hypothetical protein CBB68_14390 [Rhodospirillaceae bacterium TMED8]|nr:DNA gyrase inhibitor YacG [Magnetovibrio sp.]OUT48141.1 MAG: hypothetical protein CBB68_14390 [Rhodospirillaceae bacterium TMED8]|tara:strand:+ start:227 stop:427 length:201 start_codon:yes stop_codon:yes gene_type:complete
MSVKVSSTDNVISLKRRDCPICAKREKIQFKPFCSQRCADIDLGRWLNEYYCILGEEKAESDDYED